MQYLKNNTLRFFPDKCVGCGTCIEVCPHGVFVEDDGKVCMANRYSCMECGACQKNCPVEAVSVNSGVGCAAAVITGMFKGTDPVCGYSGDDNKGSSGCC